MSRKICAQFILALLGLFLLQGALFGQEDSSDRRVGLGLGMASWLNKCDVPAAEQQSQLEPSFGPFASLSYGKFILGLTFFTGHFHIDPEDGITRLGDDTFVFSDDVARRKRFTTIGETRRTDFDINLRYVFNRALQLSAGLTLNRHTGDLTILRNPRAMDGGGIILPDDVQNVAQISYTSNQYWISEGVHGSLLVETISNRFSLFYNATVLLILGEKGDAVVDSYLGIEKEYNSGRISYHPIFDEDTNQEGLIFESLGSRRIGTNAGMALSSGLGFEILDKPSLLLFAGYSAKFFAERETDLVDHSVFHGPFMGLSWNVF